MMKNFLLLCKFSACLFENSYLLTIGLALKTNMEMTPATEQIIRNIHELAIAARRLVRDVDPTDDLMFLRTKSNNDELLISPGSYISPFTAPLFHMGLPVGFHIYYLHKF